MATAKLKRNTACESVFVKIPKTDMAFFQLFSEKMGWLVEEMPNIEDKDIKYTPNTNSFQKGVKQLPIGNIADIWG